MLGLSKTQTKVCLPRIVSVIGYSSRGRGVEGHGACFAFFV